MAEIAKAGTPSLASAAPPQNTRLTGLVAGEALGAGDACYVKNDGKVWKSSGAAVAAAAKVRGFAAVAAAVGEAVTLLRYVTINYGSGLTPGTDLFLSGTVAGGLADAATTGGVAPVAWVVDPTRIFVMPSRY